MVTKRVGAYRINATDPSSQTPFQEWKAGEESMHSLQDQIQTTKQLPLRPVAVKVHVGISRPKAPCVISLALSAD